MYQNGILGLSQNFKKAASYYRKSSRQGYAPAQYSAGIFFHSHSLLFLE